MFCPTQTNNMISKLHERALRIVLNNHISDLEALLHKINDMSSHHSNIKIILTELYKMKTANLIKLAPPIMDSMLNRRYIT